MIPDILAITPLQQNTQRGAGAWDQLYKEAVADFPTHEDFKRYREDIEEWMNSVNAKLQEICNAIAMHTHVSPPSGGLTTAPTSATNMQWVGKVYVIPVYLNTTKVLPNITGTLGYKPRSILPKLPFVDAYASPVSLLTGVN